MLERVYARVRRWQMEETGKMSARLMAQFFREAAGQAAGPAEESSVPPSDAYGRLLRLANL